MYWIVFNVFNVLNCIKCIRMSIFSKEYYERNIVSTGIVHRWNTNQNVSHHLQRILIFSIQFSKYKIFSTKNTLCFLLDTKAGQVLSNVSISRSARTQKVKHKSKPNNYFVAIYFVIISHKLYFMTTAFKGIRISYNFVFANDY